MNSVTIGKVPLGQQATKIIGPIAGLDYSQISKQLDQLTITSPDILEWRLDYLDDLLTVDDNLTKLIELLQQKTNLPIICTYRTNAQGGQGQLDETKQLKIIKYIASRMTVSAVDLEFTSSSQFKNQLKKYCKAVDIPIIYSYHNFLNTPDFASIKLFLAEMALEEDIDVIKLSTMAKTPDDALTIIRATQEMAVELNQPLITQAMGRYGVLSRCSGITFGSVASFGSLAHATAHGQLPINQLRLILHEIDQQLTINEN